MFASEAGDTLINIAEVLRGSVGRTNESLAFGLEDGFDALCPGIDDGKDLEPDAKLAFDAFGMVPIPLGRSECDVA